MKNTNKSARQVVTSTRHVESGVRHVERKRNIYNRFFNRFFATLRMTDESLRMTKRSFKITSILAVLVLCLVSLSGLSSCADADGLHDQNSLLVTFVFKGFGDISGSYAIPGNFDSWDNTTSDVTMKNGEGTSNQIPVTQANIQFTLVPVNGWTRDWYVEGSVEGNGSDSGAMRNFYIDGLDLNAGETTVLVDISSGTAVPALQ